MWVRRAAIRPVPAHAELPAAALEDAEDWLGGGPVLDEELAEQRLQGTYDRFQRAQPELADRIGRVVARTADEVAVALGFYLATTLWLAFKRAFGDRLAEISATDITGVEESLALDEQLRGEDPDEPVDSDDVVRMEQPHALDFIQEHVEAALEVHADVADVDAVHAIYRLMLIQVLALSYGVKPPAGASDDLGDFDA
ncbi:MAG: hypothetical protein JRI23_34275 [Deltaproteobacteria bacterium]|nr:hypothetical protein [Deltaproteobacteria bacterium]MBW2537365.1 hypothetical protein [Deltaproteobacteria bacterium]